MKKESPYCYEPPAPKRGVCESIISTVLFIGLLVVAGVGLYVFLYGLSIELAR